MPPGITIEQLSQVHESFPTNPLIANPLYLAGYAERLGTGTVDIINKCEDIGLKAPEYTQTDNFRAIFWRNEPNLPSSEPNLPSSRAKHIKKIQIKEIVLSICSNEYLTVNQIAASVGRNAHYLKREILFPMLKEGKLVRLYPPKPKHPNQAYKANK